MTAFPADLEQMRFTMRHYDISCCFRINVIQNKPQDTCQTTPAKPATQKLNNLQHKSSTPLVKIVHVLFCDD